MGRKGADRNTYMQGWYSRLESKNSNGDMFWILYDHTYTDYDSFGVYYPENTSTVNIIINHNNVMNNKR
jgi:hypothetical protein